MRAINDLLARLDQSIGAQKHFLADAAHQLKTPLAGLRTQAELAQREIDAGQHDPAAAEASRCSRSRARARARRTWSTSCWRWRAPSTRSPPSRQGAVNLALLATRAVRDFVPRALEKRIDLGYEGPPGSEGTATPPGPRILGSALLLRELIRNLVDNALQYTPRRRHGHGARDRRPVRPGRRCCRSRTPAPASRAAEREQVFQPVLPLARHRRRRLRPRPGDRARDRDPPRRRDHARRCRRAAAATCRHRPATGGPGALFTVRFPAAPASALHQPAAFRDGHQHAQAQA